MADKTCSRCIHKNICGAHTAYQDVIKSWNREYPFVKMSGDESYLAKNCTEYQTLSDIHLIKKEKH